MGEEKSEAKSKVESVKEKLFLFSIIIHNNFLFLSLSLSLSFSFLLARGCVFGIE